MDLQIQTRSTTRCIDLELVKLNKRVRNAVEDDLIEMYIAAAEMYAEARMNRSIMPTTWKLTIARVLPVFALPRPPLLSLDTLKYTFDGETEVTVDTAGMVPRYVEMLPTFTIDALADTCDRAGTMEIEYTAGWANAEAVPMHLKLAILLLAGHWHTSRETVYLDPRIMMIEKKTPFGFDDLIKVERLPNGDATLNGGY